MNKRVVEEMSIELVQIGWAEPVERAFHRMRANSIRHLPVIDERGTIVGILSDRDVQRAMISQIDRSRAMGLNDEVISFDPEARVRDYMTWPAKHVDVDADLRDVAIRMVEEKVSSFLVSDGGRVIGILTTDDLLRVLIDLLADPSMAAGITLTRLLDGASSRLARTMV